MHRATAVGAWGEGTQEFCIIFAMSLSIRLVPNKE